MYYNISREINDNPFYSVYVVREGDTLYKIARINNVNPKLLSELNGVELESYIYPNQTILIPKKGVQFYITKDDDTLRDVSKIFKSNEMEVVRQNKEIYLLPGQMIFFKD